jgi:antitoxin HicB
MKRKPRRKVQIQYSMLIEWSEEDQLYLVTLPEWSHQVMMPSTHGKSYKKAAKNGRQVLEMLIDFAKEEDRPLPPPKVYNPAD